MIQPTNDRVLVRRLPLPASIPSLLSLPERRALGEFGEDDTQHYGEVLAVGPGRRMKDGPEGVAGKFLFPDGRRRPMCVKPGDRVYWGRFSDGMNGEVWPSMPPDCCLIMEGDIIGVETPA